MVEQDQAQIDPAQGVGGGGGTGEVSHPSQPAEKNKNIAVANDLANKLIDNAVLTSTYRGRDVEKRRAYMREYMREYMRKRRKVAYG